MFHGIGSSAEDLVPLGQAMAPSHRDAWMISLRSPHKSDFGQGWQWFSVQGVDEPRGRRALLRRCRIL